MVTTHRTAHDSRIENLFMSVNVGSIVAIALYGVFFFGYLLTHNELMQQIEQALLDWDFIALQSALEAVADGVMGVTGWVREAFALGLLLMSLMFILNTGGIIFSVFIHKSRYIKSSLVVVTEMICGSVSSTLFPKVESIKSPPGRTLVSTSLSQTAPTVR